MASHHFVSVAIEFQTFRFRLYARDPGPEVPSSRTLYLLALASTRCLVARLDPPLRDCIKTMFSKQPTFGLAQLPQSSRHTEILKLRDRAEVVLEVAFDICAVEMTFYLPVGCINLCLYFAYREGLDLQVFLM